MTREDKQIIKRATKESWRIGDRSHLKRLLKKNLKLYRENVELEKENTELKKEVEKHKWSNIFLEDCAGYDKKIAEEYTTLQERIEQLEKENAELKERYNKVDIIGYDALKNLTKAKEIIKGLLSCCRNYPQENAEKMKQAEQFLRENEDDLKNGCPDVLCEDCTKEDCTVRKLGLVPTKEIEK